MKKEKEQKCVFCNNKFMNKQSLYDHIEQEHSALVPKDISIAQYVFNIKYKKSFGSCVICKNKTRWNQTAERYDRLCSERCKEEYKKAFQKRMIDKHGKIYLTQDPDHQRKMLANRKISGKYKWSDGISEVGYTGSYEHEFLKFLDIVMNFNATDVISPAPQNFFYKDEAGKDHFYFPDFFIPSLNLIIEIKDGGDNPNKHHKIQEVDKKLEKLKDEIMLKQKQYNFVKVSNKDFSGFITYLIELKQGDPETIQAPLIRINESVFHNLEQKLSKTNLDFGFSIESYQESYIQRFMDRLLKEDLDSYLSIECPKDEKGNYIKVDKTRYALKEEKMFPVNNIREFKDTVRNFKNCPPLKRKKLAESIISICEEYQQTIPSSSLIWGYTSRKPHLIKEDSYHDTLKHGNDRYEIYDIKFENIESYRNINELLDSVTPDRIFMSSDWHLFQSKRKNLFTHAPVDNINDLLISNQIKYVEPDDVFIFMGDLVNDEFIAKDELILKLSALRGRKILVLGNNDVFEEEFYERCGFEIVVRGFKWKNYVFTHCPIPVSNEYINIHGHIHGSRSYMGTQSDNHIDVYGDLYSYKPISLANAQILYNKGFYKGQDFAPDYHFDRYFEKHRLSNESHDISSSIAKARDLLSDAREQEDETFESFKLMGRKRTAIITYTKGSSDGNGGYYAVNYGKCLLTDIDEEESHTEPIYILGILNSEIEEGNKVQVNIIGCVERKNGEEILIGKYIHNVREYNQLQISTLIYPQERHQDFDLYLYDEKSKLTKIVDIETGYMDIYSDGFMEKLIESFSLDVEGNILLHMKEESDFMARYMSSHRLLKIYEQTRSYENIKIELCKLYYMIVLIETYYVKPKKTNPITQYIRSSKSAEALKAKAFILNDFNKYLKLVLNDDPKFNFSEYFSKTDYYRDVIKFTPERIRGLKKIIQSIVF